MIHAVSLAGLAPLRLAGAAGPLIAARNSSDDNTLLIGLSVGGGLLLLGLLGYFAKRLLHQRQHHSHATLFQGLCQAHQLDRNSRRLLSQVSHFHRLTQPARLFTEPQWLDPANLTGSLAARREELLALRAQLFAVAVAASR